MTNGPDSPALTPALRWMSNMLCLWALCGRLACRRARTCKREPRNCLLRYTPLVPEDARNGVAVMLEGKQAAVSYEDLRAEMPEAVAAVEDWIERVAASAATRGLSAGP